MKNRNRIIFALLIFGAALFYSVHAIVIPQNEAKEEKYIADQREATTHDINNITRFKNKYMGNASNIMNLFYRLPLSDTGVTFQLFPENLKLEVNYKDVVWNIGEEKVQRSLLYNSTAAFALIDNLQIIDYQFPGASYQVKRADIQSLYPDFSTILEQERWERLVRNKMNDPHYVKDAFQKIIHQIK